MQRRHGASTASGIFIAAGSLCLFPVTAPLSWAAETGLWSQPSLFDTPGGMKESLRDAGINLAVLGSGLIDEQGVEAYYNLALTPWLRVSADLQWIDPATPGNENAVLGAVRTQMKF